MLRVSFRNAMNAGLRFFATLKNLTQPTLLISFHFLKNTCKRLILFIGVRSSDVVSAVLNILLMGKILSENYNYKIPNNLVAEKYYLARYTLTFKQGFILKMLRASEDTVNECIILLHGLARTNNSMKKITKAFDNSGYLTLNVNYPSTKNNIEHLANTAISNALSECPTNSKIHFITHSLGGILVRQYLSKNVIHNIGRVVMLGPPNKGSEIVDRLYRMPGFTLLNGPAGLQLGTQKDSVPNTLGSAFFELGIIAGTRSINPILSLLIPGSNDGKVSVKNTKLEGMADHITLPVTHTFMMNNKAVIFQAMYFLKNGVFRTEDLIISNP